MTICHHSILVTALQVAHSGPGFNPQQDGRVPTQRHEEFGGSLIFSCNPGLESQQQQEDWMC